MNSVGGVIGLPITNHFSPITSHGRASGLAPLNPSIDSGPIFGPMFKGGVEKSNQLPNLYEAVAKMGGAGFLNAGSVISTDGIDGLHLTAEWFPFLDRSELAKLELSVDRNTEA